MYTEDDLFHQRPVSSSSAPICGALAKTSRDAEISHRTDIPLTSEDPNGSLLQSGELHDRSDPNMQEDFDDGSNEDNEEFEWEQGEETYVGPTVGQEGSTENVWTGDITIRVESKADERKAAQRKPPVRRANARDKV